ncbi:hypothetical protein [Ferrovibrio terrae]|uniref:hypothetical protein n=1 Tax=Ferrovibrio terrae TaxID=2594003 RepID=UPI003137B1F6
MTDRHLPGHVLPGRRLSITHAIELDGQPCLFSIGFDRQGIAREIFVTANKVGSEREGTLQSLCVALSLLLRSHACADDLRHRIGLPGSLADRLLDRAAQLEASARVGIMEAYAAADRLQDPAAVKVLS